MTIHLEMSNDSDRNMISSKEILDKTGISRATLNNYIKLGIIPRPLVKKPGGTLKNVKNLGYFPNEVLDRIKRVRELKKKGHSMETISEIIRESEKDIRAEGETRLSLAEVLRGLPSRDRKNVFKKKPDIEINKQELKLTFEEMRFPAYLVNFDFKVIWINPEAERNFFRQSIITEDEDSNNIFKLIFNWGFNCDVKNWKDLIAYHMSFAKIKFTKTWIPRLYKGISSKEISILEEVYDKTLTCPDFFITDAEINFLKNDGSVDEFRIYSISFKEGILFVCAPSEKSFGKAG